MLPAPFTPELLARLEGMRLRAARKQAPGHGPGRHTGARQGAGLEFADYRKYAPGDDLRYLDWGLLARTDRLYVKVFREEADLSVHIFLDASASMRFPSQAEKFTPVCRVALAMAYAVLANGDGVRFHILQDSAPGLASPLFRGRRSIMEAHAFVDGSAPEGALRLPAAIGRHLRGIHRPGKAVVVSDFLMEAEDCRQGFRALQSAGFDVTALQVLMAPAVEDYVVRLVHATHPAGKRPDGPAVPEVAEYVRFGASPRGAQSLILGAKGHALAQGQVHVGYRDVDAVLYPALRHRLILNFQAEAEKVTADDVLAALVKKVPRDGNEHPAGPGARLRARG